MRYDVVIIGSGFGGLVCAHLLAKAGKRVLVLERQQQAGGCIQSYPLPSTQVCTMSADWAKARTCTRSSPIWA